MGLGRIMPETPQNDLTGAEAQKGIGQPMAKGTTQTEPIATYVRHAIERERVKRGDTLKPIEIVKVALSAYLSRIGDDEIAIAQTRCSSAPASDVESTDRISLRRGTQSAVDRMLFNANYWRAAYEIRIVTACTQPASAFACLGAVSVWTSHPLKLNTLAPKQVEETFDRFCPPFAVNKRRGTTDRNRSGKGPLPDFKAVIADLESSEAEPPESIAHLRGILSDMEAEAAAYESLNTDNPLVALFTILPAWCLQNRIELVSGSWWDDCTVMGTIIDALRERFVERGFGDAAVEYFVASCNEALDAYHRDLTTDPSPFEELEIPQVLTLVQEARDANPSFEQDGYGPTLPSWLIGKEQLIWNILVCALYGPATARPLLVDSPDLLSAKGYAGKTDVITELAQTSFARYTADRIASQTDQDFASFASLPVDLRDSSIAYITSIHDKLGTLHYEVLPAGTCYPERCVTAFTASEVECLAILEHRRWLRERQKAGWRYGPAKDVARRQSPYLVPWEELPDRAKEWNRSAVRSIPNLLASVNLAVVR